MTLPAVSLASREQQLGVAEVATAEYHTDEEEEEEPPLLDASAPSVSIHRLLEGIHLARSSSGGSGHPLNRLDLWAPPAAMHDAEDFPHGAMRSHHPRGSSAADEFLLSTSLVEDARIEMGHW